MVVMGAQLCEYTKKHWLVHFTWMGYIVCKLHIIEMLKKKRYTSSPGIFFQFLINIIQLPARKDDLLLTAIVANTLLEQWFAMNNVQQPARTFKLVRMAD